MNLEQKNAECFPIKLIGEGELLNKAFPIKLSYPNRTAKKNASRCMEIIGIMSHRSQVTHTPKAGVAAARQLCHNNKEVMERLLLMRPDSSSGGNCNLLPLPTAWTTEGPNPRIWNPKPSAESGILIVLEMKGKSKLPSWDMHTIRWNWHCVCVQRSDTYSLGLVLTSTRRGPLLLKHCLRRASTSEKGLRNTRSPFIANNFFPTSRPAILKENMKNKRNKYKL